MAPENSDLPEPETAKGSDFMNVLFLGAGKMATAIARGIVNAGVLSPSDLSACDISAEARDAFREATGGISCTAPDADHFRTCDVLLLAVKPQVAAAAVAALPPLRDDVLVISIAAGIPLASLEQWFGTQRLIRTMPNTPLMVGCGATVFARGPAAGDADAAFTRRIFGSLGLVEEIEESLIDAVTAVSGSGPAYIFEMIQALTAGGVRVGLPADLALALTVQTVSGAAEMLQRGLGSPDELRRAVTSPGGTTAAGLAVLAAHDFRELIAGVVRAARDRSLELGASTAS
jgi:pyrroline-5-carboxylate reductase